MRTFAVLALAFTVFTSVAHARPNYVVESRSAYTYIDLGHTDRDSLVQTLGN